MVLNFELITYNTIQVNSLGLSYKKSILSFSKHHSIPVAYYVSKYLAFLVASNLSLQPSIKVVTCQRLVSSDFQSHFSVLNIDLIFPKKISKIVNNGTF